MNDEQLNFIACAIVNLTLAIAAFVLLGFSLSWTAATGFIFLACFIKPGK